jgi:hypothetical protein
MSSETTLFLGYTFKISKLQLYFSYLFKYQYAVTGYRQLFSLNEQRFYTLEHYLKFVFYRIWFRQVSLYAEMVENITNHINTNLFFVNQ